MEEKTRILIIDDDVIDRMNLSRVLKDTGLEVDIVEASDGMEGLAALSSGKIDCIFMDYLLPKENGLEILQKIRFKGIKIPVIMLTGHGSEETAVELMKAGATDYLNKSKISANYMGRILRQVVRLTRAEIAAEAALEALKKSEARTRDIIENTPDAIFIIDWEGIIESLNPAAELIFGYNLETLRQSKTRLLMLNHNLVHNGAEYLIQNLCSKANNLVGVLSEGMGKRFNGTNFPVEISISEMGSAKDKRFICLVRDISERKQAQSRDELLQEVALRVLDESPEDEVFQYVCEQLLKLYELNLVWIGLKENDGLINIKASAGTKIDVFRKLTIRWDDTPEGQGPLAQAIRTGKTVILDTNYTRAPYWLDFMVKNGVKCNAAFPIIIKGKTIGAFGFASAKIGFFTDELIFHLGYFSRQIAIAMQAALSRKNIKLQTKALESAANAIAIFGRDGIIQWVNPAFLKLRGYTQEEIIGQNLFVLKNRYHDPNYLDEIWQNMLTGQVWKGEIVNKYSDGSFYTMAVTITPVKDTDGEIQNYIAIYKDITERMQIRARDMVLHRMALMVIEEHPLEEILEFVCQELLKVFDVNFAWIGLKEADGSVNIKAKAVANAELSKIQLCCDQQLAGHGTCVSAFEEARPQIANLEPPDFKPCCDYARAGGILSVAASPLIVKGQNLGVFCLHSSKKDFFKGNILFQLENLANQVAIAIQAAQSQKQLKLQTTTLQAAANAIVITGQDGSIQWVNEAFTALTGYLPQEVWGQNPRILKSGVHYPIFYQDIWQQISTGLVWKGQLINRRKDGSLYTEEMTITPVKNEQGEIVNFIAVKEDITERKKAEEALRIERQRFFMLLDGLPAYVFLQAPDYSVRFANRYYRENFGDPEGSTCYQVLHGLSEPCKKCQPFKVFQSNQPQKWEWAHKNGRIYEVYDYPFPDVDGSPLVMELGIDITKQKQAATEMLEAKEKVTRSERLASLGTMAAGIAHEINQPLNSLKVTTDGMLYWHKKGKPADIVKVMENLEKISAQAGRIDNIIKHMRSFVRNERYSELVPCNLNNAVEGAFSLIGNQLTSHGIQAAKELAGDLPPVMGFETRLEEVVINLLVNAMQSLDKLNHHDKKIHCKTWYQDGLVFLEISDNGAGVDESVRDKIFEPFFTTKTVGEGMGLGLSIVHSIVTSFKGQISLNSSLKGASFRVELPESVRMGG